MYKVKKLCVYGVAAMSLGVPAQAAMAQCGIASWYHEGSRTANGERYRPDGISAAHRTLPFGTLVQVRNQRTGRSITVRINDRGPFIGGRIIDLSRGAQRALGGMDGLASVCLAVQGRGETRVASAEDGERQVIRRRARTRYVAAINRSDLERPSVRRGSRHSRHHARITRRSHHAALHRGHRHSARGERRAEGRSVTRRSHRAVLREQRRMMQREAAAEWRAREASW